jgi:acyl-CoA thioester hydrolase
MTPKIFSDFHIVGRDDIDELMHVNNIVYLKILQELAIRHWSSAAPKEITESLKWVVKKHEIEYFYQAGLGEELFLKTWIETLSGATSLRRYEIYLDEKLVVRASTFWVAIHPSTLRPVRIPVDILEPYFFE